MDEDEDVTYENSPLYEHLLKAGFEPGEFFTASHSGVGSLQSSEKSKLNACLQAWFPSLASIYQKITRFDEIRDKIPAVICRNSLLCPEDVDFLENFIENQQDETVDSNYSYATSLSLKFRHLYHIGALGAFIIPLAAMLRFNYLAVTFSVPLSVYLLKKRLASMHLKSLSLLLASSASIRSLLHKSLQFLQEMELLEKGFMLPGLGTYLYSKAETNPCILHCRSLREIVNFTSHVIYLELRNAILAIRKDLPIPAGLDNESHYLACSNVSQLSSNISLLHLKSSYRNVIAYFSEYFRRLALGYLECSLSYTALQKIESQWSVLMAKFDKLKRELSTVYNYYTAWKARDTNINKFHNSKASNAHADSEISRQSLDRHLRATVWLLEDWSPEKHELQASIGKEVQAVNACYELWLQTLKPVNVTPSTVSVSGEPKNGVEAEYQSKALGDAVPLFGPWNDLGEDQVLEAEVTEETYHGDDYDDFDTEFHYLSREERLQRREEAAVNSRRLLNELHNVLQHRAVEWRAREAKALGKCLDLVDTALLPQNQNMTTESHDYETGRELDALPDDAIKLPESWAKEALGTGGEQESNVRATETDCSSFGFMPDFAKEIRLVALQRIMQTETLGDLSDEEDN